MGLLQGEIHTELRDCRLHHFQHRLTALEVAPALRKGERETVIGIEKGKGEEFTTTESAIRTGGMTSIGGRVVALVVEGARVNVRLMVGIRGGLRPEGGGERATSFLSHASRSVSPLTHCLDFEDCTRL
jgi:hypothetical protein